MNIHLSNLSASDMVVQHADNTETVKPDADRLFAVSLPGKLTINDTIVLVPSPDQEITVTDRRDELSGIGGEFLEIYHVPEHADFAFALVPPGEGDPSPRAAHIYITNLSATDMVVRNADNTETVKPDADRLFAVSFPGKLTVNNTIVLVPSPDLEVEVTDARDELSRIGPELNEVYKVPGDADFAFALVPPGVGDPGRTNIPWEYLLSPSKDQPCLSETWDINVAWIEEGRFGWQITTSDPDEDDDLPIDTGSADWIADYIVENAMGFEPELMESLAELANRDARFLPLLAATKARMGD